MINVKNLESVKKLILKENKPIIIKAQSYEFNKKLLESVKFDVLLFF